jgi:heme exporter protein C
MHALANPLRFLRLAAVALPLCLALGTVLTAWGLYIGLFASPPDYLQGDSVRIMYVHVPAAWLGLGGYSGLAAAAVAAMVWRHPLADVAVRALAPVGALFTAICLATGSLWGRPTWGTWWAWDGRMTSMLVLLLLYLGVIALSNAWDDRARSARAAGILAIVGTINLPIIKYSVEWWNTLHQPASITLAGKNTVDPAMLQPLLLSVAGFTLLFAAIVLMRMRTLIAEQRLAARQARRARISA